MRLSYTPPPSIYNSSLCHLSASRLGSDRGSLSVTTLLACLLCLPSLWLTGYMNISMCCLERSGSGPPPLLCAGRGCTHSWCPQACEGEELGRWLAVCELLFRGAPGMMLRCKSRLIQEHLVHNLEACLMFCSKIVIPAFFWIAQLWITSSELWSFWGLVPCWFSWKKEWWRHLLVKIFNP